MARIISILFLSLMLVQVIPVPLFFSYVKKVLFSYIEEEKHSDGLKEKKESKECLSLVSYSLAKQNIKTYFPPGSDTYYTTPVLEYLTPPPDCCS